MRRFKIKQAFLLIFVTMIIWESCKKDKPIYPLTNPSEETGIITPPVIPADSNLLVSTVISGLNTLPQPSRICSNKDGTLFISSALQGKVFKVTANGKITTILQHRKNPVGLTTAKNGDVYVAIAGEDQIVKITPKGAVSTLDISIGLNKPLDVAVAENGTLYIADTYNRRIVKLTPKGLATVFAGSTMVFGTSDGVGQQANFCFPSNIKLATDGFLWVVDGNAEDKVGQKVRRISAKGEVKTIFTEKIENMAILDIAVSKKDKALNTSSVENLFLVHQSNAISYLSIEGIETPMVKKVFAGNVDGPLKSARFNTPSGIAIYVDDMYIVDYGNNSLRKITKKK
ncbi:hypothetical protein [Mucilaginibacter sp.]|uniref:hypothetical protein n=1 Tax=Mucilaginibacter sp. TaxID=1882438 RepID=UPI0035667C88